MKIYRYFIIQNNGDGSYCVRDDHIFSDPDEADNTLEELMDEDPESYSSNEGVSVLEIILTNDEIDTIIQSNLPLAIDDTQNQNKAQKEWFLMIFEDYLGDKNIQWKDIMIVDGEFVQLLNSFRDTGIGINVHHEMFPVPKVYSLEEFLDICEFRKISEEQALDYKNINNSLFISDMMLSKVIDKLIDIEYYNFQTDSILKAFIDIKKVE